MKKILWLLLVGACTMASLPAQNMISGRVMGVEEEGEKVPLVGASVYWLDGKKGTFVLNEDGSFQLKREKGRDQLVAKFTGMVGDTLAVGPEQKEIYFELETSSVNIKTEVITGRRMGSVFSRMDPVGVELISQEELRKAACCNLGESFETNPSVDLSFSDAVTGTRQIRMLGLAGQYATITNDNMPLLHGLAAVGGLDIIPGPWINSIQIAKGAGSVVNGFEAMAGQINLQYRDPFDEERLHLNGYANIAGRLEGNAVGNLRISEGVGTNVLLHVNNNQQVNDRNGDGFLDMPRRQMLNGMNRWRFRNDARGLVGQVNVNGLYRRHEGGQSAFFDSDNPLANSFYLFRDEVERYQAFAKFGWYDPNDPLLSFGSQYMYLYHDQNARFGNQVYEGRQQSLYINLIGQLPLDSIFHTLKLGFSYQRDNYEESFRFESGDSASFDRIESVPGFFAEYTFSPNRRLDVVAGLRSDLHNYYGNFITPRLNIRFEATPSTIIRGALGRGQRTPNLLTDQLGLLASSRVVRFDAPTSLPGYGFLPEVSWNFGVSLTQDFTLDFRPGQIRAEAFRTNFPQQVVVDRETPGELNFYALNGLSFANSFLLEAKYELVRRLDVRLAYRFYDVRTVYRSGQLLMPFNPRHRGFVNVGYTTRKSGWLFDATVQIVGPQRLPGGDEFTETYPLLNAQVNKEFGESWEVYIGGENVLDYRQENPIVAADSPFGPDFDATLIWAPVFGRNVYAGFRYTLK